MSSLFGFLNWFYYPPEGRELLFLLPFVFALGAIVGSFLNVCIYRMPQEKSLWWPGSRCGNCLQPIRWRDNLPLLSYWWLGGRCRTCKAHFSVRYFLVELLTASCFAGLFWLEVIENVHQVQETAGAWPFFFGRLAIFAYHTILLCFLLVAIFVDLEQMVIPLPLTLWGTLIGVIGGTVFPWPWPYTAPWSPTGAAAVQNLGQLVNDFAITPLPSGTLQLWPLWQPLPGLLAPGGNWQTGLVTSLVGAVAGTLVVRLLRFLFGLGMGAEYTEPVEVEEGIAPTWIGGRMFSWMSRVGGKAMGLGDADLMMMAGSFLGWQPVLVAFFVAVVPGLFFGLSYMAFGKGRELPFGPSLALGVLTTAVCWHWLGPQCQFFFFEPLFVFGMGGMALVLMLVTTYLMRLLKMLRA